MGSHSSKDQYLTDISIAPQITEIDNVEKLRVEVATANRRIEQLVALLEAETQGNQAVIQQLSQLLEESKSESKDDDSKVENKPVFKSGDEIVSLEMPPEDYKSEIKRLINENKALLAEVNIFRKKCPSSEVLGSPRNIELERLHWQKQVENLESDIEALDRGQHDLELEKEAVEAERDVQIAQNDALKSQLEQRDVQLTGLNNLLEVMQEQATRNENELRELRVCHIGTRNQPT